MKRTIEDLKLQVIEKLTDTPGSISVTDIKGLFDDTIDSLNREEFLEFIETFKFAPNLFMFDLATLKVGTGPAELVNGEAILTTGRNLNDVTSLLGFATLDINKQPEIEVKIRFPDAAAWYCKFGFYYSSTDYCCFTLGNVSTGGLFKIEENDGGGPISSNTGISYIDGTTIHTLKLRIDEYFAPHYYINDIVIVPDMGVITRKNSMNPFLLIANAEQNLDMRAIISYFRAKWLK